MLNRVPLSLELGKESSLHSSSQWNAPNFPPLAFSNYLLMSGLHVSRGLGGRRRGRMSGSLLRCLQEAGLWLDLRQHLCNRSCLSQIHIRFPCKLSEIFSGGKVFRLEPSDIYHIVLLRFWSCWFGSVCVSTFFFLYCNCATLQNNNWSHDLIVFM